MPLLGLIGYPLGHSFSPDFFRKYFASHEINSFSYQAFPLSHIDMLPGLISDHPDLIGLNVTIPYKESVLPFLDNLDEEARAIGAVNTISIYGDPKRLKGFNTDAAGFINAYSQLLATHERALVLGSGGASKAVCHALRKQGISFLVVSRLPVADQISYIELDRDILSTYTLVINTTPLGMNPDVDSMAALPIEFIGDRHALIDLVYNPPRTKLMLEFERKGATVVNGISMLHEQALLSWEIWSSILK